MAKYHISKSGEPAVCRASVRPCPIGGESDHFKSKEEAAEVQDVRLRSEFSPDAMIDMDSGTVLGTDVVVVEHPGEDAVQDLYDSDSEAISYAREQGVSLDAERDPDKRYVAIDLHSGTVVSTNLAQVSLPEDQDAYEEIHSSDNAAYEYAKRYGYRTSQESAPLHAV